MSDETGPEVEQEPTDEPEVVEGVVTDETVADEVSAVLAVRDQTHLVPGSAIPSAAEYSAMLALADRVANTAFVPVSYRGRPDEIAACFFFGREIGLGPMMSLRDVYMIDGRPALASHRQLALLRKAVVIIDSEATPERAHIHARRTDTGEEMAVEWTMEEAKKIVAKGGKLLTAKDNWKNYPADMLWARCVGRLTRRLGPDLLGGLPPYVAEELADLGDWSVDRDDLGDVSFRRVEQPKWNAPKGWPEIGERLNAHTGVAEAEVWVRQALEAVFKVESVRELPLGEPRVDAAKRLSGVIFELDELGAPGQFPPLIREQVRAAFAKHFDGTMLPGPPWRMDSSEEILPTREEHVAMHGEAVAEEPVEAPSGEAPEVETTKGASFYEPVEEDPEIEFGADGY